MLVKIEINRKLTDATENARCKVLMITRTLNFRKSVGEEEV